MAEETDKILQDEKKDEQNEYSRQNGENLTNKQAIESCKHEQNRDIIDNCRLGSYDRFGNYIIVPAIREELLSMPKIIYAQQKQKEKLIFDIKSLIPLFGDIFFKLVVTKEEVTFFLVETVRREAGDYVEVYEEVLDNSSLAKDEEVPLSLIFRNYNIYKEDDEDYGKRMFSAFDFMNILTRKIYLSLLSKELLDIGDFDDKKAFDEMIEILKNSGEYGERVLDVFAERLKDRPEIYDLSSSKKYNKAVLEILLSAIDIATTQADKDNFEIREIYFRLLGVRNRNIEQYLREANQNIDEEYITKIVKRATKHFLQDDDEEQEDKILLDFMDKISPLRSRKDKRKLDKPILKQGLEERKEAERLAKLALEEKPANKEEAIKQVLTAKKDEKKPTSTPAGKKLKPAKKVAKKKSAKKKPAKKKSAKKAKAKVKAKKPVKKPADVKKASAKNGKKMTAKKKPAKKKSAKKDDKKKEYEVSFTSSFLEKYRSLAMGGEETKSKEISTPTTRGQEIVKKIKSEQKPKIQNQAKEDKNPSENFFKGVQIEKKVEIKNEKILASGMVDDLFEEQNSAKKNVEQIANKEQSKQVKQNNKQEAKQNASPNGAQLRGQNSDFNDIKNQFFKARQQAVSTHSIEQTIIVKQVDTNPKNANSLANFQTHSAINQHESNSSSQQPETELSSSHLGEEIPMEMQGEQSHNTAREFFH
ncbi:MAG: hypothetical protein ACI4L7_01960 [Christensenellales bacterium]